MIWKHNYQSYILWNRNYKTELKKADKGFDILSICDGEVGWGIAKSNESTVKGVVLLYNCKIILCSLSSGKI